MRACRVPITDIDGHRAELVVRPERRVVLRLEGGPSAGEYGPRDPMPGRDGRKWRVHGRVWVFADAVRWWARQPERTARERRAARLFLGERARSARRRA